MDTIPYGHCHCGCGGETLKATRTNPARGHVKGQPFLYLRGHWDRKDGRKPGDKYEDNINGYIRVYLPDHPHATKNKTVAEHRLIMENYLGRYLNPKEVVHHKDRNKRNNDIDNLELISSQKEHRHLHGQEWRNLGKWSKKYTKCLGCKRSDSEHCARGFCQKCYNDKAWEHIRKGTTW